MSGILSFYNLFLICFLADGAVSVLDVVLGASLSVDVFAGPRMFIAVLVMLGSIFAYLGMGLFASLPKRILFLPTLFPIAGFIIFSSMAVDKGNWRWHLFISALQLVISLHSFYAIDRLNNGQGCLLKVSNLRGSSFRWKNSLVFFALNAICLPVLLVIVGVFAVANNIQTTSKGYISFAPDGSYSAEKHFIKDQVELRLLGMAHIGDSEFYENIKNDLQGKEAVVLMEGVTDDKDLLQTPPDYSFVAENLGLENQREKFSPKDFPETVDVVRADLDVSDFASGTVEILELVGKLYSKDGFSMATMLLMQEKFAIPGAPESFIYDLVGKRNDCLIGHIQENLEKHNLIIVPWGAMHLPGIEDWVLKNGFALKEEKSRKLFAFSSMLNRLLGIKPL